MATQANPVAVIRQNIEVMAPQFKAALPAHVTVEKFSRVAMTAIQSNPQLQNADRASLFGAVVKLAQDGLLPDGREAALVMFGNKAQAMPMIAGVLKKIRQSGEVSKISAQVVYENDAFTVSYGFDEDVTHNPPPLDQPRGKAIGAYATAVLKDGTRMLEVMSLEEIEKVRKVSRASGNGPWVQWWGEMARKTVMRRLSKRLPMSTDLEDQVFANDETMATTVADAPAPTVIEGEVHEPASRLEALEAQIEEAEVEVVEEGKPDEERGEGFTDETPAWQAEVDKLRASIADAADQKAWKKAEADYLRISAGLPDDVAADLDDALTAKRGELGGAN